jgi:hypothetical protein
MMEYRYRIQTEDRYGDRGQPIKAKYTPFDFYNTVLKIARKRSMIDAVLTVSGASEIWTQDVEDNPELYQEQQPTRRSLPKPPPGSPRRKPKANGNSKTMARPELVTGFVSRVWPNTYQGQQYWFAKLDNGRQVQTTNPELGAQLLACKTGEVFRAYCNPSPKPGKVYLVSFDTAVADKAVPARA